MGRGSRAWKTKGIWAALQGNNLPREPYTLPLRFSLLRKSRKLHFLRSSDSQWKVDIYSLKASVRYFWDRMHLKRCHAQSTCWQAQGAVWGCHCSGGSARLAGTGQRHVVIGLAVGVCLAGAGRNTLRALPRYSRGSKLLLDGEAPWGSSALATAAGIGVSVQVGRTLALPEVLELRAGGVGGSQGEWQRH